MNKSYPLKVVQVVEETKDSKSLEFQIPDNLKEVFTYKSGQYLTLCFNINGDEVRRAYSLCSSPYTSKTLKVGVKRVKGGLVSNYINDKIKVGDTIEVLPPMGEFYVDVTTSKYKSYYLFAAGSGITPILSILKSILKVEVNSYVYLAFGNTNQTSIMFDEELKSLQKNHADRLVLVNTLSQPKSSWKSLFSSKDKDFKKGRIDNKFVKAFIQEHQPYAQDTAYYICGPEGMITNTKQALEQIDVPAERIFMEYFGTASSSNTVSGSIGQAKLTAYIDNERVEVTVKQPDSLLRALLDNNHDMPFSCEGGVCGMCKCKLTKGEVVMNNNLVLGDEELAEGYILACQSKPTTEVLEIHVEE